jgi:hypothetical protein
MSTAAPIIQAWLLAPRKEAADEQDAKRRYRQAMADEAFMGPLPGRSPEEAELDGRGHDGQHGYGAAPHSTDRTTENATASRAHAPDSPSNSFRKPK